MIGSNQGVRRTSYNSDKQIMVNSAPHFAVGVVVSKDGGVDSGTGLKIIRAGTPLYGDLDDRTTPFTTVSGGSSSTPVGILQHDCDVTYNDGNGECVLIGVVNVDMMHESVQALITEEVKAALPTVKLLKLGE